MLDPIPMLAIAGAVAAIAVAQLTRARIPRRTLHAGAAILVLSWLPIVGLVLIAQMLGDAAVEQWFGNALGFGLLAWFGTGAGLITVVAGVLMALVTEVVNRFASGGH